VKFSVKEKQFLKNFHGHIGPYVLLGYKIGKLAVLKLKSRGEKLNTQYFGPDKKPLTCLVDGLQIATGCTYGIGNIKIFRRVGLPKIVFKTKKDKFVVKLKQELTSTKQIYNLKLEKLIWKK